MLNVDHGNNAAFEAKLSQKIGEKLTEIILKENKGLRASDIRVNVRLVDDKVDLDIDIDGDTPEGGTITIEEHRSGTTKKKRYLDRIIHPLLAKMPDIVAECEEEMK